MEVKIKDVEAVGNSEHGTRYQILRLKAKMPEKVSISKRLLIFFENVIRKLKKRRDQLGLAR